MVVGSIGRDRSSAVSLGAVGRHCSLVLLGAGGGGYRRPGLSAGMVSGKMMWIAANNRRVVLGLIFQQYHIIGTGGGFVRLLGSGG